MDCLDIISLTTSPQKGVGFFWHNRLVAAIDIAHSDSDTCLHWFCSSCIMIIDMYPFEKCPLKYYMDAPWIRGYKKNSKAGLTVPWVNYFNSFCSQSRVAQDKVGIQRPHHVMTGSDCGLDWSHVPQLKSAEGRQSRKNRSPDAAILALVSSEYIPHIILSANKTSKQGAQLGGSTGTCMLAAAGSDASYSSITLLNVDEAQWTYSYPLLWIKSGCSEQKQ